MDFPGGIKISFPEELLGGEYFLAGNTIDRETHKFRIISGSKKKRK